MIQCIYSCLNAYIDIHVGYICKIYLDLGLIPEINVRIECVHDSVRFEIWSIRNTMSEIAINAVGLQKKAD